jgi:hypothetical protein
MMPLSDIHVKLLFNNGMSGLFTRGSWFIKMSENNRYPVTIHMANLYYYFDKEKNEYVKANPKYAQQILDCFFNNEPFELHIIDPINKKTQFKVDDCKFIGFTDRKNCWGIFDNIIEINGFCYFNEKEN